MSDYKRVAIIMAGGAGERFWPLSRRNHPKQLLCLADTERSMLQQAVDRLVPLVGAENVYVATGRNLEAAIQNAELGIPVENVLAEPCKRNTTGCLVYVAAHLLSRFDGETDKVSMSIVTADHNIPDTDHFHQTVETAMETSESTDSLVTIGIKPTRVETGYGYIEISDNASPEDAVSPVKRFTEKPDKADAEAYVASGRYFWNSGMFFWRLDAFMNELRQAQPEITAITEQMKDALLSGKPEDVDRIFEELPDISIDYALMEKANQVKVVPASFQWDDVGSWDALYRTMQPDENGNILVGSPITLDTKGSVVYNAPGKERIAVSVIGMEDVIVVVSEDGVMIAPRDRVQDVKQAVNIMKEEKSTHL